MSFESDFIQYPSIESTDALRPEPFYAPPPQHTDAPSPELFDQELAELDLDLQFELFDDFLPTFHDSIPDISTPSTLTYSTESVHEGSSSYYSSDFTQSDHSIPSDIESHYSLNNGLYGTHHDSTPSVAFSNGPLSIPSFHPAEAQFDFGTSDLSPNFVGISPEDSTAMRPPPTPLPVHVTAASESQVAPAPRRPFKCPHCLHSSKTRYNLKTHIGIHKNSKPFKCSTCGSRFTRKHDLDRHCRNPRIHQKQITINGDPRLMTSAPQILDSNPAIDISETENIIAW